MAGVTQAARPGVAHAAETLTGVSLAEGHGARAAAAGMLAARCAGPPSSRLKQSPAVTRRAQGAVMNYGGSFSAHHRRNKPAALLAHTGVVYSVFLLTQGSFVDFFNF